MRLQRIAIYRLTRILAGVLPAGVVLLVAIAAWDYRARAREVRSNPVTRPGEFPDNLSVRTKNFNFTRSENGKPLFKVTAKVTLGYKDKKRIGQDVDVEIYPKKEGDPVRYIHGDECSHDAEA